MCVCVCVNASCLPFRVSHSGADFLFSTTREPLPLLPGLTPCGHALFLFLLPFGSHLLPLYSSSILILCPSSSFHHYSSSTLFLFSILVPPLVTLSSVFFPRPTKTATQINTPTHTLNCLSFMNLVVTCAHMQHSQRCIHSCYTHAHKRASPVHTKHRLTQLLHVLIKVVALLEVPCANKSLDHVCSSVGG